eukprot:GHUV01019936.1.p2 GENE.GHUV01019936.1~~GHUV01019936.1.p2  ORF type:complete len:114 (-),score=17.82 GHUV01019936.1:840-1181(-)
MSSDSSISMNMSIIVSSFPTSVMNSTRMGRSCSSGSRSQLVRPSAVLHWLGHLLICTGQRLLQSRAAAEHVLLYAHYTDPGASSSDLPGISMQLDGPVSGNKQQVSFACSLVN